MLPMLPKRILRIPLLYGTYLLIIFCIITISINLFYQQQSSTGYLRNTFIYTFNYSNTTTSMTAIEGTIIAPVKIRFDIMKLIQYKSINTDLFNKYIQNTTSNECSSSLYNLLYHDCCMHQFSIFYLYSLGFTTFKQKRFDKKNIDHPIDHKTMWNHNQTNLGCLGLRIQLNWPLKYKRGTNKYPKFFTDIRVLGSKTKSYSLIQKYCIAHNITKSCDIWLPKTYNFQVQAEKIEFFKQLPCNNKPNNEYLLKSNLHQGSGIRFIQNSNFLRNYYLTQEEQEQSNPLCVINKHYEINLTQNASNSLSDGLVTEIVAQQFFTNALRINKCTFHIRAYIMIANWGNPLIVFYAGMVIYRSTDPSEIRSNMHQQTGYKSDDDDIDWNLSLEQLEQYYNGRVNGRDIIDQITNMTRVIMLSVYNSTSPKRDIDVQLYSTPAMDFVLTEDLQVKFLDFNILAGTPHMPDCFEEKEDTNGMVAEMKNIWQCIETKRICEEMVNIEIELALKKKNGDKIDKLDSVKNFEVIVWE